MSIYMPLSPVSSNSSGKQNELHWKECVRNIESGVGQYGGAGRELLQSVETWDSVLGGVQPQGKSVAVFRSPDVFQIVWLEHEVKDRCAVGPHFFIRPLLPELMSDRIFYLLALSQKNTRLLRCTSHSSEEVPFRNGTVSNFDTWMNAVKRDHNDRNSGSVGPSGGSNNKQGAIAPMGSDKEAKDEYLSHYFKQIDGGVNELLKGASDPLVIAGVEYELPIYREVNNYPHLCGDAVRGAPDGLKGPEMLSRAFEVLRAAYAARVETALADWNHRVGGGASSRIKDVVTAAHDGRVLTLLISDWQEKTGLFREESNSVVARETGSPEDEDLVNDAVVQTILHAGKVLVVPHRQMPNGQPAAAIFRY
jgi:hypothetical protein